MSEVLRHGSIVEREEGRVVRIVDRFGHVAFAAAWDGRALLQARLATVDGREVVIRPLRAVHPVLGACHEVTLGDERSLSLFAAVDLCAPDSIPAMDRPGALPAGAGTAVLCFLARQALEAGRPALRYRGPYPTGALFDSLSECFSVADPASDAARFVTDVEAIALEARAVEVPVDFVPDPFERVRPRAGVVVQLRRDPERLWVDGHGFTALTRGSRRLVRTGDHWSAILELGGRPWGTVARIGDDGSWLEGPMALPAPPARLVGGPLPASVRGALRDELRARMPALARAQFDPVWTGAAIGWGDPGIAAVAVRGAGIVLHAGLLETLATLPPAQVLAELADVLEEPLRQLIVARLSESAGLST